MKVLNRSIRKLPLAVLAVGLLFAFTASQALAAPTFTTEKATEVAATSATLNATLSPDGHPIDYMFSYGTTSDPSEWKGYTPLKNAKATLTPFSSSEPLTGLKPGTTYYYAIAVHLLDFGGFVLGSTQSFTTLSADGGLQFMAGKYPAEVNVELGKERVLEALGGSFKVDCTGRHLLGSLSAASNSISVQPSMTGCSGTFGAVTVKPNSCRYMFDLDHHWGMYTGSFAISCSKEGDAIEYTSGNFCTVKLPAQSIPGTSSVAYQNTGPASARVVSAEGWAYNLKWTASGGFCNGSGEDGSLASFDGTTVRGFISGIPNELFVAGLE